MSAWRRWLRRLWPERLAGQMIALLLLALILAQTVSFLIFADERLGALRTAAREHALARTASLIRLIESTPPAVDRQITRSASTPRLRFWLSAESAVARAEIESGDRWLAGRLHELLDDSAPRAVRIELDADGSGRQDGDDHGDHGDRDRDVDDDGHPDRGGGDRQRGAPEMLAGPAGTQIGQGDRARDPDRPGPGGRERWHGPPPGLVVSARLVDGRWLNAGVAVADPARLALPSLLSMVISALALSVIVVVMVRRTTRPLAQLAAAAERLGRGEATVPVPEAGPLDVRQTTRAFNRMHDRLERFVQDRTRMLAAISHDLRTPITTLRLRAEFIEDQETRARMLATLDEMARMTEATLAFAREEAAREDTRSIDLAALVDSLCQDLADLGLDVDFAGAERTPLACRPVSLKRAIRNLVENAVAYGARARVALGISAEAVAIVIDDDGPGIAPDDRERVFQPFVRLEESRAAETGGIGLGMAIARSIVRGHGGDITLAEGPGGGLRVTVQLPRAERA